MAWKTALSYGEDIRARHIDLEAILAQDPARDITVLAEYEEMRDRIRTWAVRLDIQVHRAKNEQNGWTQDEILYITADGLVTAQVMDMPTKAESGYNQVADYNFFIPEYSAWGGLAVERKSKDDLYQTLFSRDENMNWQRDRLYREVNRYHADPRFDTFLIFAECNLYDFLIHAPRFDPNTKKYNHSHEDPVNPTQKRAAITQLMIGGTPIIWCGNRKAAATLYAHSIRAWNRSRYYQVLGLQPLAI